MLIGKGDSMEKKLKYANPYLAGFALGLTLLFTFYVSGHGLGASGAVKNFVISATNHLFPDFSAQSGFFSTFVKGQLFNQWIVVMFIGLILGGFISGATSGRLKLTLEKGPRSSKTKRVLLAILGGMLFGIGSQLGKGCTSGAALSGMAVLSASGIITMMAIFGTGFILALFFRKYWI